MIPKVTVLMSVYNSEIWLSQSIESVLNQTFRDFEFLIVNDGSTDDSLTVINRYAKKDPRIRVVNKQNSGLADSLNYGIKYARGEWIARIDADDLSMPQRLEKQMVAASSEKDVALIGSGIKLIDENGVHLKTFLYPSDHNSLQKNLNSAKAFFAHSSAFYKASVVRRVGGYRGRIYRAEDHDLWLRLSEIGRVICVSEALVHIRQHKDQISHDQNGERQIIDSYVAMVSYWLRKDDQIDPVNSSPSEFEDFYCWLSDRLNTEQIFLNSRNLRVLKRLLLISKNYQKIVILLKFLSENPLFAMRWLQDRFWGSDLPKKLAVEWRTKSYE